MTKLQATGATGPHAWHLRYGNGLIALAGSDPNASPELRREAGPAGIMAEWQEWKRSSCELASSY